MHEKDNIEQEIYSISPKMAALPRQTPYVVPDGYMEQSRLELLKPVCMNQISAPKNYFELLPKKILQHIDVSHEVVKESARTVRIRMSAVIGWTVAASILLITGIFSMTNKNTEDKAGEITEIADVKASQFWEREMDQLEEQEMIYFLEENGHDVEAALVASYSEMNIAESEIDVLLSEDWLHHFEL
jgi:hypothetical protein